MPGQLAQEPPSSENSEAHAAQRPEPFFRVRLINIDHVLSKPGALDRTECAFNTSGAPLKKVPILRVFGATPAGQRVCLHIHQAFPYCYVEYKGSLAPDAVLQYIARLGRELNHSIALSLRLNPFDPEASQFIAAIHLCKGVPFYGYHVGWRYFLKISFIDPSLNHRLGAILESGHVMRTKFQPYEAHIRYQLQFMLDYNLFGCDYIDIDAAMFRPPLPPGDEYASQSIADGDHQRKVWSSLNVPSEFLAAEDQRVSYCELEIDATTSAILNRRTLRPRNIHQDFGEMDLPNAMTDKLVPSLRGLWEDEQRRRINSGLGTSIPAPETVGENRRYGPGEGPEWMAEERLRAILNERIRLEQESSKERERRPENFTSVHPFDAYIMTTFQSVEVFHPHADMGQDQQSQSEEHSQDSAITSSKLYDLEYACTQARTQASQGQKDRTTEQLEEALSSGEAVDEIFFASQQFQKQLHEVENEARQAELDPDDEGNAVSDGEFADQNAEEDREEAGSERSSRQSTPSSSGSRTPVTSPCRSPQKSPRSAKFGQNFSLATPSKLREGTFSLSTSESSTVSPGSARRKSQNNLFTSRQDAGENNQGYDPGQGHRPNNSASASLSEGSTVPSADKSSFVPHDRLISADSIIDTSSGEATEERPAKKRAVRFASEEVFAPPEDMVSGSEQGASTNEGQSHLISSSLVPSALPPAAQVAPAPRATPGSSRSIISSSPTVRYVYSIKAPSRLDVTESFGLFGLARKIHQDPYYSNPIDVPEHPREYAGRTFKLSSMTLPCIRPFQHWEKGMPPSNAEIATAPTRSWQYESPPPSRWEIGRWRATKQAADSDALRKRRQRLSSQVEKVTQVNEYGFKHSQHQPSTLIEREKQHMTVLAIEVHVCTRGKLLPDPETDEISAICFCFQNEDEELRDTGSRPGLHTGIILLESEGPEVKRSGLSHLAVEVVDTELELLNTLIDKVRELDPEIIAGYECHNGSWGYVIERAQRQYDFDLVSELGRVRIQSTGSAAGKGNRWGYEQSSALKITGRHVLNIWRLMRGQLALTQYTFENVVFHVLHRRVPKFSHATLTEWYRSGVPELISRALRYWVDRVEMDVEIIEESELVFRTAEFARIYGIDFFSVISRGSQFKVESVMFRIAKPESFLLLSPNVNQVGKQNAAECLPLIMEPQSAFYKGPLLVLDFQSLYPSIMIAYNICYSTCLGRVGLFKGTQKLGVSEMTLPKGLLSLLQDHVHVSPNGLIYVNPNVRRSLLSKMLTEILDTRVMVKASMKGAKNDKAFLRLQNARQLSLKLLANVTYGYTSATFSGRMPCVEIADSIVQYGRETLEKAIEVIHGTPEWGAEVVYGDTDSVFVYLPGRTKDDAFKIGNAIAETVTTLNPPPVKLKFEKVYFPSLLLAKKRYVGFKYEAPDELEPAFDAKGIETVRRDGTPAGQRMMEACIKILFRTQDVSAVKEYCQRQWKKILEGNVSVQDFIFAKEVRLGTYSDKVPPPPGAAVSSRRILTDPRSEPQHAERVPYVISQGEPGAKLVDQAVSPEVMLANPQLQLNGTYYIKRQLIPAISRVFNLIGVDVMSWFDTMPRNIRLPWNGTFASDEQEVLDQSADSATAAANGKNKHSNTRLTLTEHYRSRHCLVCGQPTEQDVCLDCRHSPTQAVHTLLSRLHLSEARQASIVRICASCANLPGPTQYTPCESLDCPILYTKKKVELETGNTRALLQNVSSHAPDQLAQIEAAWEM